MFRFEHIDGLHQDELGILRPPPDEEDELTGWFRDPGGNLLSVVAVVR